MRSETCSRCGEEVRYGTRGVVTGYLHRTDVDHPPIFGRIWTPEDQAHVDAELDRERVRERADGTLETYTARTVGLKAKPGAAADEPVVIPEPEQRATPVTADEFPPRSGIRQILALVEKTDGWTLTSLTAARGPYIGTGGTVLSISDSVLMRAAGPILDSGQRVAVASWRDGAFDFAYTGVLKDNVVTTTAANSKALKAWIKEPT